jgi:hypothetical protein
MKKTIAFLSRNYFPIQGIVLWATALFHILEFTFWYFAVAAIIVSGLGELLSELRKLNENEKK